MASVLGAYKPVDWHIEPTPGVFPEEAHIIQQIPKDPLKTLPPLLLQPPDFQPFLKLTTEQIKEMKINDNGYLLLEEEKLFKYILQLNKQFFTLKKLHHGTFHKGYFSPYIIPIILHIP